MEKRKILPFQSKRKGLEGMTPQQFHVLNFLRECASSQWLCVAIEGVDRRIINSLLRRNWIASVIFKDEQLYEITAIGRIALQVYETPARRTDGLCPRCEIRPKEVFPSGRVGNNCTECRRILHKEQYDQFGDTHRNLSPCSRCNRRERHIFPSGRYSHLCRTCLSKSSKKARKKLRKRVRSGEVILCTRCHEKPRHCTQNTVYQYCVDCEQIRRKKSVDLRKQKVLEKVQFTTP